METKGRAVKDPTTGELKELIAVMRDVSARVARDEALKDAYDLAETRALTDGLTGLGNRRSFDEILELEWKRSDDEKTQLSLLMIDADHFKHYNDSYGHQSGDACLCTIAGIIGNCIRQHHDFAARYGGEEFAVILPNTNPAGALAIAERLRETVATHPMEPELDPKRRLTVSIGVATGGSAIAGTVEWTARDLLHGADMALYEAKRTGRNRVCIHAGQSH
jgi:diguanylate cyclase (GGDEF)-like protein